MRRPEVWSLADLAASDLRGAYLLSLQRFEGLAQERLKLPVVRDVAAIPGDARALVVIGGGSLIDEAKHWRLHQRPDLLLVAIPSLWGSGAEASPVAVLNRNGKKSIEVDDEFTPHIRVIWPDLADGLPDWRAREACGDAWSHALEGFLSPLASSVLRAEIAELIKAMLLLPLCSDSAWFEHSARACAAQAQSSVGLVHGIAHTLEGALAETEFARAFGHARLCSLYLSPVLEFNRSISPKFDETIAAYGLDGVAIRARVHQLFDAPAYKHTLPALATNWRKVLRDPCSRTNSVLVRPTHLDFFLNLDEQ